MVLPQVGTPALQARVLWYIYIIMLTPGSEGGCLGLNGPCVCYTNLGRTSSAYSKLRNPHLNWAFLKLSFIRQYLCGKKCKYKQLASFLSPKLTSVTQFLVSSSRVRLCVCACVCVCGIHTHTTKFGCLSFLLKNINLVLYLHI